MKKIRVILVGESNVGKTSLINNIGQKYFKVSNFSGTTIEQNIASTTYKDYLIEFIDLPGIYSLNDDSLSHIDRVVIDNIYKSDYDIIVNVASATMLDRNLNLFMDLLELKSKVVLCVNMVDELNDSLINYHLLTEMTEVKSIGISAKNSKNIDALLCAVIDTFENKLVENKFKYPNAINDEIEKISTFIQKHSNELSKKSINVGLAYLGLDKVSNRDHYVALKLIQGDSKILAVFSQYHFFDSLEQLLEKSKLELELRYDTKNIKYLLGETKQNFASAIFKRSTLNFEENTKYTDKIDKVALHSYLGVAMFFAIMWVIFQTTFLLGSIPMEHIESAFNSFGLFVSPYITSPNLNALLLDGILPGISAVMMFLPNIMILFLGITLLESTGYLTRVGFLLDGFLQKFGLHGQSIVPLIIGFGCTVPAYMATRILESKKDKIITLFILGFISCSAKLPVYVLFVSAFFESSIAGTILFGIYMFGVIVALVSAKFLQAKIFTNSESSYIMEIPKYRMPSFKLIYMTIWLKTISYVKKAGFYITIISTIIWFASTFPRANTQHTSNINQLQQSYLGQIGQGLEPIFEPIGFDWKMSIALLSGVAAKEVIVSTLGVLYVVDAENNTKALIEKLRTNITFASAMSFIVFIALYLPCFAATVVFAKESGEVKYLISLIFFTLILSWLSSYLVYNGIRIML